MRMTSTSLTPPAREGGSARGSTCTPRAPARFPGAEDVAEGHPEDGEEGAEVVEGVGPQLLLRLPNRLPEAVQVEQEGQGHQEEAAAAEKRLQMISRYDNEWLEFEWNLIILFSFQSDEDSAAEEEEAAPEEEAPPALPEEGMTPEEEEEEQAIADPSYTPPEEEEDDDDEDDDSAEVEEQVNNFEWNLVGI